MRSAIKRVKIFWQAAWLWLLFIHSAWADQPLGELRYQDPAPVAPPIGDTLLRLVISLMIVIGLAIILVKILQKNKLLSRQSAWARVVDQISVGQNKTLVLAEIFGKVYVLGVTDHSIATLLGENDIDLSQIKQVFAEAENSKRLIPSYLHSPFLQILDLKIERLKKRYTDKWKDGSPR